MYRYFKVFYCPDTGRVDLVAVMDDLSLGPFHMHLANIDKGLTRDQARLAINSILEKYEFLEEDDDIDEDNVPEPWHREGDWWK